MGGDTPQALNKKVEGSAETLRNKLIGLLEKPLYIGLICSALGLGVGYQIVNKPIEEIKQQYDENSKRLKPIEEEINKQFEAKEELLKRYGSPEAIKQLEEAIKDADSAKQATTDNE